MVIKTFNIETSLDSATLTLNRPYVRTVHILCVLFFNPPFIYIKR